ncbi:hypothetical protein ANN_03238 [Periplaneta americana]|uniref:Uncharacterized protein n=1 Tax=Periplaneta americana TaxID=6978 RepID=A0ABQ8TYF5_PERAM|nr:hypothetical protein ANN_03238 [Periplaneta americana]
MLTIARPDVRGLPGRTPLRRYELHTASGESLLIQREVFLDLKLEEETGDVGVRRQHHRRRRPWTGRHAVTRCDGGRPAPYTPSCYALTVLVHFRQESDIHHSSSGLFMYKTVILPVAGRNGEREKTSMQKKISDDRRR